MNPYRAFVAGLVDGMEQAASLSVSGTTPVIPRDAKVLLFSPHPDDECIYGTLPLRLMRELEMEIVNVPVTFGSNKARQQARSEELARACAYLGWRVHRNRADLSPMEVPEAASLLEQFQPSVIFFPHDRDWNSRHISTHHLMVEALAEMPGSFRTVVVETEFWGAMADPNLMVEADVDTVADLVAATSLHEGEVARNPYHLLLPAWMQDNVRRGGELVGGQGGAAPDFFFATLYRLREWKDGAFQPAVSPGRMIPAGGDHLEKAYSWKS